MRAVSVTGKGRGSVPLERCARQRFRLAAVRHNPRVSQYRRYCRCKLRRLWRLRPQQVAHQFCIRKLEQADEARLLGGTGPLELVMKPALEQQVELLRATPAAPGYLRRSRRRLNAAARPACA
jgi:hypothetical protein